MLCIGAASPLFRSQSLHSPSPCPSRPITISISITSRTPLLISRSPSTTFSRCSSLHPAPSTSTHVNSEPAHPTALFVAFFGKSKKSYGISRGLAPSRCSIQVSCLWHVFPSFLRITASSSIMCKSTRYSCPSKPRPVLMSTSSPSKLAIFVSGPLVGNLMDSFPRMHSYNFLNQAKTAAQVISGIVILHALRAPDFSVSSLQTQTWFVVLLLAMSADKLASLALDVSVERDWVVMLAGAKREIALVQANAMLNRVDLLCETGGASLFAVLLSKYGHVMCIKFACVISVCTLPLLMLLSRVVDHLSLGVVGQITLPQSCENFHSFDWRLNPKKIVKDAWMAIKRDWNEYVNLPVLPASVTYVLLCFNTALSPGSLMTTFLIHKGLSPYMFGLFSGSSAMFGFLSTFASASIVKRFGIFKAGAVGLLSQALPLITAVLVYWTEPILPGTALASFLALIVLSRWGQMSYSVIGLQIIQTGVHPSKANLIGTIENSVASLAELVMMGLAVLACDVSHYGLLAALSACSVIAATLFYCHWLARTND